MDPTVGGENDFLLRLPLSHFRDYMTPDEKAATEGAITRLERRLEEETAERTFIASQLKAKKAVTEFRDIL